MSYLQFLSSACVLSFVLIGHATHLTAQTTPTPLTYTPLATPCRAVDTRLSGGPILAATSQSFNPSGGGCSIAQPNGPIAYALNVTVVPHGGLGYLSIWPTGEPQPLVSTLNAPDGRVKANAAIVGGGNGGEVSIYATDTTDVVLDVLGYFTTSTVQYTYVPVTPCRLVDTRLSNGALGSPSLVAGQQRAFPLATSNCLTVAAAKVGAVSLNVTVVPRAAQPVDYLTVWGPYGAGVDGAPPLVSTLNAPPGVPVANAAIVTMNGDIPSYPSQAGDNLDANVYSTNDADLVLDLTGYFIENVPGGGGLTFNPMTPCRVLDTRDAGGVFVGELTVPFTTGNTCDVPNDAKSYVTNATVIPAPKLGYLTLWPNDTSQPVVSTLNAPDGSVTSNMAIIGTDNGSIDAFAQSPTNLVLDISGYFSAAPTASLAAPIIHNRLSR